MSNDLILYSVADKVATVTLNRPERHNAINYDMCNDLHSAMIRANADPAVSVIMLTGAGKSFCVGADIGILKQTAAGIPAQRISNLRWPLDAHHRPDYQQTQTYFPLIGKPIISMINGSAAGLGLIYACYSDIRFCADDAYFAAAFVRRGLAIEWGLSWLLPKLIGHGNAADFLLSGRKITAQEAKSMGLVNRTIPREQLEAETYAYAAEMATLCPPHALRMHKVQLWESYFQTLAESIMMSHEFLDQCIKTEDYKEAVLSFVEKRTPHFLGR